MPKRPPTPEIDPDTKFLAIYYPYPALPRLDEKGLADAKELARWIACICGQDDILSIYYRPKSPNTVVIEITGNSKHFRRLLGAHKWKDCFKMLRETEKDMFSKIYFSTFSTHRHLEKLGWKLVEIQESWFKKLNPQKDAQIKYPYPESTYCEVPTPEEASSYDLFRPLPVEHFPQATLREAAMTVLPAPTVGSHAWSSQRIVPGAPTTTKGVEANNSAQRANNPPRKAPKKSQAPAPPLRPAPETKPVLRSRFPNQSHADAYASIFGNTGPDALADPQEDEKEAEEAPPVIDYDAEEEEEDDIGWLTAGGPTWDTPASLPKPVPVSAAPKSPASPNKLSKTESDNNKTKKKKNAKKTKGHNELQTMILSQDKVPVVKEKPASPTQVTIVQSISPDLDPMDFDKEPIFDATPSFNWADEVSREEVAKAIQIVSSEDTTPVETQPREEPDVWTKVEAAKMNKDNGPLCPTHGVVCKPGICAATAAKIKAKNKNNYKGETGHGWGGSYNRGTAQAGGRGRGWGSKK
ncbi:hypothetical protein FRC02_006728 [Tulasnella sp. 418]|nr:hypothetical protein FRC02_006728 [Tulasnella sp. 418]